MSLISRSQNRLLFALAIVAIVSVAINGNTSQAFIIMLLAYPFTTTYSIASRSGMRNSALFHAIAVLVNNVVWYSLLNRLVVNNLTIVLFLPYTVATVYGSLTGAKLSQRIEERFGITTSTEKPTPDEEKRRAKLTRKALISLLLALIICLFIFTKNIPFFVALTVMSAVFANEVFFSLLRRSRNSSSIGYHICVSLLQSTMWYLLYRTLAEHKMSAELFWPYCVGAVFGNLVGQDFSIRIERMIGASADKHLTSSASNFIPWKPMAILGSMSVAFILLSGNILPLLGIVAFAVAQQISFTIVSRSRNRSNTLYHAIASIFSNGVWFLTFRQINHMQWTPETYIPFATGSAMGSITGAGVSMKIERAIGATSDAIPKKASA